jgi:hypothetical protein
MTDFTESIAFLSIVKIFICRYSPWQIRIFAIHPRFPPPLLILLLFPVNINECRVLQVSLVLRFKFKTDLIINWIYPIKTHSRETWGKSNPVQTRGPWTGGPCFVLSLWITTWRLVPLALSVTVVGKSPEISV